MAFAWEAMDTWYEEEERILSHPRAPYHRINTRESSRHVRVILDGETLADTEKPRLVFETNLPTRYYLPPEDVRMDLLEPGQTRTICAYKGEASYWSATLDGEVYEDVAWSYPDPLLDNPQIQGSSPFSTSRPISRSTGNGWNAPRRSGRRASLERAGRGQRQRAGTARDRMTA